MSGGSCSAFINQYYMSVPRSSIWPFALFVLSSGSSFRALDSLRSLWVVLIIFVSLYPRGQEMYNRRTLLAFLGLLLLSGGWLVLSVSSR